MKFQFLVFSSDWKTFVETDSYENAAVLGMESKQKELGELFTIAYSVVVVKTKTKHMKIFSTVPLLEDLGLYNEARSLAQLLKTIQ